MKKLLIVIASVAVGACSGPSSDEIEELQNVDLLPLHMMAKIDLGDYGCPNDASGLEKMGLFQKKKLFSYALIVMSFLLRNTEYIRLMLNVELILTSLNNHEDKIDALEIGRYGRYDDFIYAEILQKDFSYLHVNQRQCSDLIPCLGNRCVTHFLTDLLFFSIECNA